MTTKRCALLIFLCAVTLAAQQPPAGPGAVTIPVIADPTRITEAYRLAIGSWITAGQTYVGSLFAILALLDLIVFGAFLALDRHTLETGVFAATRKLMAIAWFFTLMLNGTQWMPLIINSFITLGKAASGVPSLAPSTILQSGVNIAGTLLWSSAKSGFMDGNLTVAVALVVGALFVFFAFLIICLQFVVALVDTYIAVGIGTFFLALGGSKWTVPYVERYFAFCVATGVKLMAMYLLVGATLFISQGWKNQAAQVGMGFGSIISGWIIGAGALLLAFVVWHCSRLVSSVLGGSPTLTGSDVVAFMAPFASAAIAAGALAAAPATSGASLLPAAGAAASAAGGMSGGLTSGPPNVSPPSSNGGGRSAQPQPPGGGGGKAAAAGAKIVTNFIQQLPHSGHHGGTPKTGGF